MIAATLPPDEAARITTLRTLSLLDTPPEPFFEEVAALAKELARTDIALVSLVDSDRQWFKACIGLDARETSRHVSFCAHAILENDVFWIEDARSDPRFHDPIQRCV